MKYKIFQSIGFKIIFFYILLSLINVSFVISIIFENQIDLISKNTKLKSEIQLTNLINSIKKFTFEMKKGTMFNIENDKEALNQIIKLISLHAKEYLIFTEKNEILFKSNPNLEPPKTFNEDGLRSMTAMTFSGKEYYLRIDEEKKIIYSYIPLNIFQLGNSILLVEKDISFLNDSLKNLYYQAIYVIIVILIFHAIFAVILFRYIIHPIILLNNGVKRFSEGKFNSRISSMKRKDEFGSLAETLNRMAESIHNNIETLSNEMETVKESKQKIEKMAIRDELTGLYNRVYLFERINEELPRVRENKSCIALLLIDLDHFNEITRIYGHQTGDIVLKETAKTIMRKCMYTDIIARFGDEEFAVLTIGSSANYTQDLAEGIKSAIEENVVITPDGEFRVTATIGISYMDGNQLSDIKKHRDFFGLAEAALKQAKEKGRNRIEIIQ